MLRSLILWRITKTAYLTALLMAFIIFAVQIFRLGFVLFGLPPESSFPFFLVWFVFYGFYFLPDGLFLATALTAYELKEKRLLHVLYSFQLSPIKVAKIFLIPAAIFFFLYGSLSYLLVEEHVGFVTRGLLIQYKDRLFENIPVKTFMDAGNVVVYVRDREGNVLKDIFLKYKNIQVIARRARYEGAGRFVFEKGSLLTEEKGKYLLMKFDTYRLDTEEFLVARISKKIMNRDRILNGINTLTIIPFSLIALIGSLRFCRSHTQLYVVITGLLIFHQLILFAVKVSL
jgi:hypothetical protein